MGRKDHLKLIFYVQFESRQVLTEIVYPGTGNPGPTF